MNIDANSLGSSIANGLSAMGDDSPSSHGASNYGDFLQKIGMGVKNAFTPSPTNSGSNYSDMMPGSSGSLISMGLSQTGDK